MMSMISMRYEDLKTLKQSVRGQAVREEYVDTEG